MQSAREFERKTQSSQSNMIKFIIESSLFYPDNVTIQHVDLRGNISTGLLIHQKDIAAHKQRIIREVLYNEAHTLFIGRLAAYAATTQTSERRMLVIDKLKSAFPALKEQPDMYNFLLCINDKILPGLVAISPGPESRFKNYTPQLNALIRQCELLQEHFTKEYQRSFNYITANQQFSTLMKEYRQK